MIDEDDLVDALRLERLDFLEDLLDRGHQRLIGDRITAADEVDAGNRAGRVLDHVEEVGRRTADHADALIQGLDQRALHDLARLTDVAVAVDADRDRRSSRIGLRVGEVEVDRDEGVLGAREHARELVDVAVELVIAHAVHGQTHGVVELDVADAGRTELRHFGRCLVEEVRDRVVTSGHVEREVTGADADGLEGRDQRGVVEDLRLERVRILERRLVVRAVDDLELQLLQLDAARIAALRERGRSGHHRDERQRGTRPLNERLLHDETSLG
ncbi:MAG: hypothetical protein HC882_05380 [Acidobacteria bacterium]|nr:hypothetical protein [Acidobacteriota bacterium]